MTQPAPGRPRPVVLAGALDRLPDGVLLLAADWTVVYGNPAACRLLGGPTGDPTGREVWVALPGLADSLFRPFLLHARSAGTPVTWRGYHAPAGRWLSATAEMADGLLQVSVRSADPGEGPAAAGPSPAADAEHARLLLLAEASDATSSTLDTAVVVDRLARLLVPRLCDWATVTVLPEDGAPERTGRAHRDPLRLADVDAYLSGRLRGARDQAALAAAVASGEPVRVTTPELVEGERALPTGKVRAAWRRLEVTSCLFVPLRARGETIGVMSLVNTGDRPPHSEQEMATAVEVARRAALALDNARLYARQVSVAETLQRSLLPPPPQPDPLQIAVRYRPAGRRVLVGGDFSDAFLQADGATLLVIGDVVGHNVDAAAAMGRLSSTVRAVAYDRGEGPARTLTRVDRVVSGLHLGTLATALLARVEPPDGAARSGERTLRWSSAGHLPPLVLSADGRVRRLDTPPERLLGVGEPTTRTEHETVLRAGDTLVLYTDGLVEHRRSGIDEGIARLTVVLAEEAGAGVEALCDRLLSRIVVGRADDDIAVLAVRLRRG